MSTVLYTRRSTLGHPSVGQKSGAYIAEDFTETLPTIIHAYFSICILIFRA